MADTQGPSSTTLLDQLANLDPQERREVATIVRGLSETLAEVPDGKQPHTCSASWLTCSTRPDLPVDLYRKRSSRHSGEDTLDVRTA